MSVASNMKGRTSVQPGECVVICAGLMCGVRGTVLGFQDRCVLLSILLLEGPAITSIDVDAVSSEREFKAVPFRQH